MNFPLASKSANLVKWSKLLGVTGGSQILIQGVGFICGIFIIRILSTEQYAYYTLANTMLATMTILADGGIGSGVMAEGGKNWRDRRELGKILATGMAMRRQFATFSLLVSVPILFYLLREQDMEWQYAVLLIACLAPTFWAALSGSLLQIVPKLHQDINELLKINVRINIVRLLVTIPLLLVFPFAALAVLASGISQVHGNLKLRKLSLDKADWQAAPDPIYRAKIMQTVKKILPGSIYYCISGQITVWLIAIFSDTASIAQIGALSRLAMLLTLVRAVVEMLIVPRYARLPPVKSVIINRYFQMLGLLLLMSAGIATVVYLFPDLFLWILGKNYSDLQYEVFLMSVGSCLSLVSGVSHQMSSSRGIIPHPYVFIATVIVSQILILSFVVDYTTLAGVISFSIASAAVNIGYRIVDFLYQTTYKMEWRTPA